MGSEWGCYSWQESDGNAREALCPENKIINLSGIKYHIMRYTGKIHRRIQLEVMITVSGNIYLIMTFIAQLVECPAKSS